MLASASQDKVDFAALWLSEIASRLSATGATLKKYCACGEFFASSSAAFAEATASQGEKPIHLWRRLKVERVVLNALAMKRGFAAKMLQALPTALV